MANTGSNSQTGQKDPISNSVDGNTLLNQNGALANDNTKEFMKKLAKYVQENGHPLGEAYSDFKNYKKVSTLDDELKVANRQINENDAQLYIKSTAYKLEAVTVDALELHAKGTDPRLAQDAKETLPVILSAYVDESRLAHANINLSAYRAKLTEAINSEDAQYPEATKKVLTGDVNSLTDAQATVAYKLLTNQPISATITEQNNMRDKLINTLPKDYSL